jgi:putative membrane protein
MSTPRCVPCWAAEHILTELTECGGPRRPTDGYRDHMTSSLIAAGGRFGRMHERGFHPFLGLLCLVALGAAIGWIVWLVIRRKPVTPPPAVPYTAAPAAPASPTAAAEAILAERLARGEIDPDDYRARLDVLRSAGAPPAPPAQPVA